MEAKVVIGFQIGWARISDGERLRGIGGKRKVRSGGFVDFEERGVGDELAGGFYVVVTL